MTEAKSPRPGSARAKLEAFEPEQKGKKSIGRRLIVMVIILIVIILGSTLLKSFGADNSYFEVPKNAAHFVRQGEWDKLRELFSTQVTFEGVPSGAMMTPELFIQALKSRGESGLGGFATSPHSFHRDKADARVEFFATWSRGNLAKPQVIPLVQTWLVRLEFRYDGDDWKITKVVVRKTMATDN